MPIYHKNAKNFLTKSERFNYTCNPYGGCSHGCIYCYAHYMASYRKEKEPWGSYLDIRDFESYKIPNDARCIFISTVTDPYQPIEATQLKTQKALMALKDFPYKVSILTKNALVLRDIGIFKQMPHVEVGMSIATVDEKFHHIMEKNTSPIQERLNTLKKLHEAGITTYIFICPIFPKLTNYKKIIELSKDFTDYYMFDFLNLRGENKTWVLQEIKQHAPEIYPLYEQIYIRHDFSYLQQIQQSLNQYAQKEKIHLKSTF